MTVGQGIKLKSVSVRSWRWTSLRLPRNPRIAARVLLERANLSFVLSYVMTDACGSLRFSAIVSASLLFTLLHSGAIPPVVVKTRGLNEDFSMPITLWLYLSIMIFWCKLYKCHICTIWNGIFTSVGKHVKKHTKPAFIEVYNKSDTIPQHKLFLQYCRSTLL